MAGLVTLLAFAALVATGPAARAHDVLIASDPEEGAVLQEAPQSLVLTFNNPPLEVGSALSVVGPDGETVTEVAGTADGNDVVFPLDDADVPAGDLEARWRVASSDGHPIDGVIGFTVEAAAEPAEPAATADAAPVETTEPAAGAPAETTEPDTGTETEAAEPTTGTDGMPTWLAVVVGLAVVGAVVGLIVVVARRLRSPEA